MDIYEAWTSQLPPLFQKQFLLALFSTKEPKVNPVEELILNQIVLAVMKVCVFWIIGKVLSWFSPQLKEDFWSAWHVTKAEHQ